MRVVAPVLPPVEIPCNGACTIAATALSAL